MFIDSSPTVKPGPSFEKSFELVSKLKPGIVNFAYFNQLLESAGRREDQFSKAMKLIGQKFQANIANLRKNFRQIESGGFSYTEPRDALRSRIAERQAVLRGIQSGEEVTWTQSGHSLTFPGSAAENTAEIRNFRVVTQGKPDLLQFLQASLPKRHSY